MKFCKDCDCFRSNEWGYFCANSMGQPDPVTGHRQMSPCYVERSNVDGCGPNGMNFKPSLYHRIKSFPFSDIMVQLFRQ